MRKGFTLIEMSIVLVVIGLLVAGVIIAQSLIRTSKVQTIVKDVATYQSAISQFKQKYISLPGDMANATTYWGTNPNCASGLVGSGTQTCNGNGNGKIEFATSANYEQFLLWQHLANAGLITGQYTGTAISGTTYNYCTPGVNCPAGQVNPAQTYLLGYRSGGFGGNTTNYWDSPAANYMSVGLTPPAATAGFSGMPLLTVQEAASLDTKVDDGLPGLGLWRSFTPNGTGYGPNCVISSGTGVAPVDGTIASEATAIYNIGYSKKSLPACAFIVQMNF